MSAVSRSRVDELQQAGALPALGDRGGHRLQAHGTPLRRQRAPERQQDVGGPEHQVQEVRVARVALEAEQGRLELGDAFATS